MLFRGPNKSGDDHVIVSRKYKKDSNEKINNKLLYEDWSTLYGKNVNDAYDLFLKKLIAVLDEFAPLQTRVISDREMFNEYWMNVKLCKYNAKCRKLCLKAKSKNDESSWVLYRTYRNVLNRLKCYERKDYYEKLFVKIGKNSKALWGVLNKLVGKTNDKSAITGISVNGSNISDKQIIANTVNNHFITAGTRVQSKIPVVKFDPSTTMQKCTNNLLLGYISEEWILKTVQNMKNKSSKGFDGISNRMLKDMIPVIVRPLCIIFNKSIKENTFPDSLKLARVIPLYKSGAKDVLDNYRPISLLPVFSKILEKFVFKAVMSHMESNNLIYSRQFGFRVNHSTSDAIFSFLYDIL